MFLKLKVKTLFTSEGLEVLIVPEFLEHSRIFIYLQMVQEMVPKSEKTTSRHKYDDS